MDLTSAWTAYVRAEHNVIRSITMHLRLNYFAGIDLDVATTTVDRLLELYRELDDQLLALVGERRELGRDAVEPRILTRLDTHVRVSITIE